MLIEYFRIYTFFFLTLLFTAFYKNGLGALQAETGPTIY